MSAVHRPVVRAEGTAFPRRAVLLAGGRATRLGALARDVPKPLLPVQGVPVIERLVVALREAGVEECTIVSCHHAEIVEARLGDGSDLGVRIGYLRESEPLGTAGFLGCIERPERSFFLVNADVVTDLCFRSLAARHERSGAAATLAVWKHVTSIAYGVVDFDHSGRLTSYREKPKHEAFVGMGVYCLAPRVCGHVATGKPASMPEVLASLLAAEETVVCHPHDGIWVDIGSPEEYARSQHLRLPLDSHRVRRMAA